MNTHIKNADLYRPRFLVMRETSAKDPVQAADPDAGNSPASGGPASESKGEADEGTRNDDEKSVKAGNVGILLASLLLMTMGIVLINKFVKR